MRPETEQPATPRALDASQVFHRCDPASLGFASTADVSEDRELVGQERALAALEFGARSDGNGFNLYVLGPPGSGRHGMVRHFLEREAGGREAPLDWCYVNNFQDPRKPLGLFLPPGRAAELRRDMQQLVDDLQASVPAAFESESYRGRLTEIEDELRERRKQAMEELQKEAEAEGMAVLPTPNGFAIAPVREGKVLSEEQFNELPEDEQARANDAIKRLSERLRKYLEQLPVWHRERRQRIRELDQDVAMLAVGGLIEETRLRYEGLPAIQAYLDGVQTDVRDNVADFRGGEKNDVRGPDGLVIDDTASFQRYEVNVVVSHADTEAAPVVYESNPGFHQLVGRVEHVSLFGTLSTDFTMIRPGALHGANGGYLMLDAERLLTEPFAWQALKRCLLGREVRIESMAQAMSLISTQGLEPDPMPLTVKVVLIGNRRLYYLLCEYDQDFPELFKIAADFEDDMVRDDRGTRLFAGMLASIARQRELAPFSAPAIARVIEYSSRLAGDRDKLATHKRSITDLMCEANYIARERAAEQVSDGDVEAAAERQVKRLDRVRSKIYEAIDQGLILVDTSGERIGQVNALSVSQLGAFRFGQPTRITSTVRIGDGDVVDIEREVKLGGAIHSKGVLILSSLLGARYCSDTPLSLRASLVFEQQYGGVEGDSASVAEWCALLSAISGVPIRQSLAITGSVNQHGDVQSIGGINEKIEGFFEICRRQGLNGNQGVVIPQQNVRHLMLGKDVRECIAEGRFHIFPVQNVDQAMSLLTGRDAGTPDAAGEYPDGSVNRKIAQRLLNLAQQRQQFASRRDHDTGSVPG